MALGQRRRRSGVRPHKWEEDESEEDDLENEDSSEEDELENEADEVEEDESE